MLRVLPLLVNSFMKWFQSCEDQRVMRTGGARLAVVMASLLVCGSVVPHAQDSPESVFEVVQRAFAERDFHRVVEHIAPSKRVMMAFTLDMGVDLSLSFAETPAAKTVTATYAALRARYKVREPKTGPMLTVTSNTPQKVIDTHIEKRAEALYKGIDIAAYIPELLRFAMTTPMMQGEEFFPQAPLTHIQVHGDRASGRAKNVEIAFVREGGRWYLVPPL